MLFKSSCIHFSLVLLFSVSSHLCTNQGMDLFSNVAFLNMESNTDELSELVAKVSGGGVW